MAKSKASPQNKNGRPTKYSKYWAPLTADLLASSNMNDEDIAKRMKISPSTLNLWKKQYPEFKKAIKEAKDKSNLLVESSCFAAAMGEFVDEVTQHRNAVGEITSTTLTRRWVPRNMGAIAFWLKNRAGWRDRHDVVVNPEDSPIIQLAQTLRDFRLDPATPTLPEASTDT